MRAAWHNVVFPEYQQAAMIEMRTQFLVWLLKGARVSINCLLLSSMAMFRVAQSNNGAS